MINEKDARKLLHELRKFDVQVPGHRDMLRLRLLTWHAYPQALSCRMLMALRHAWAALRALLEPLRQAVGIGLIIVVGGFFLAKSVIVPDAPAIEARQLAITASKKVQHMDPQTLALVSRGYEDIRHCLEEAINSKNLSTLSVSQLQGLTGASLSHENALVKARLLYNNAENHRIIIALNNQDEPAYVMDLDAVITKSATALESNHPIK